MTAKPLQVEVDQIGNLWRATIKGLDDPEVRANGQTCREAVAACIQRYAQVAHYAAGGPGDCVVCAGPLALRRALAGALVHDSCIQMNGLLPMFHEAEDRP